MKSKNCTILQFDRDGIFCFHCLKSQVDKWVKKSFKNYKILKEKDLNNECNLYHYTIPFLIIINTKKHYKPNVGNTKVLRKAQKRS